MDDLASHLDPVRYEEYARHCDAMHGRLVHSNLAAHVVWEILEFERLAGDVFMPSEQDLLRAILTNAADRVVVTVVALSERKKTTLNFGVLGKFLETHAHQVSQPLIRSRLAGLRLEERRSGLLGRADKARHELIAHFNVAQAIGTATEDRRILIGDVLALQDEAQEIFDILRIDRTIAYTSHTALTREMLRLLAAAFGARIRGDSKQTLQEITRTDTVLPTISPWLLGRLPGPPA